MARRFGSAMISNTDSMLCIYFSTHIRVKAYFNKEEFFELQNWVLAARHYDFNVWTDDKRVEKLRYIHRNPVKRGLVERPEEWPWSRFRHYASGIEGTVEIESQWTARKREQLGTEPRIVRQNQSPHPVAQTATRMGHPQR